MLLLTLLAVMNNLHDGKTKAIEGISDYALFAAFVALASMELLYAVACPQALIGLPQARLTPLSRRPAHGIRRICIPEVDSSGMITDNARLLRGSSSVGRAQPCQG